MRRRLTLTVDIDAEPGDSSGWRTFADRISDDVSAHGVVTSVSWEYQDEELVAKRQQLLDQAHAAEKAGYTTAAAKLYERADEVRGDG